MIAVDTSTLIAYLAGEAGRDVGALDLALAHNQVHLPPVVVTEMLSAATVPERLAHLILALPILAIADGYWERAGRLRGRLRARGGRGPRLIGQKIGDQKRGSDAHAAASKGLSAGDRVAVACDLPVDDRAASQREGGGRQQRADHEHE